MSAYRRVRVAFYNEISLIKALDDAAKTDGFSYEHHPIQKHLKDYHGYDRPETATYIIRRKYVGRAANDLGFSLSVSGEFEAIISEHDIKNGGTPILNLITQRYAYHQVMTCANAQGYNVTEEEHAGSIHLVLERAWQ